MNNRRFVIVLGALAAFVAGGARSAGQGLAVNADAFGPRWQARVLLNTEALPPTSLASDPLRGAVVARTRSAAVLGDYYLAEPWFGDAGGLRLTSGLLVGQRGAVLGPGGTAPFGARVAASIGRVPIGAPGSADAASESALTWPYLGVGYSGGAQRGGFAFSADFGLAAQNPSAIRFGRMGGTAGFDDWVREMRLTPLLQLGVSYRF
jgi:hypothetical protein